MEANESLNISFPPQDSEGCPRCEESWERSPTIEARALGDVRIRRCMRCGTRATTDECPPRLVFGCEECGQPFLDARILPHGGQQCASCRESRLAAVVPGPEVVEAAEAETRTALDATWRFVGSRDLSNYLDGILSRLAQHIDGAPTTPRVVLFDEPRFRTLALPSGTVLMSLGALCFLDDEAELAFVLAHELAHAASGEISQRLVRAGFSAVASPTTNGDQSGWAAAAVDLIRLGYGRRREQAADTTALDAMLALRYDPESARRCLERLRVASESGDAIVAESAMGHPPACYRLRKLERALYGRVDRVQALRVNREVFRRATSLMAIPDGLDELRLTDAAEEAPKTRRVRPWIAWGAVAAATLGLLSLALRFLI